MDRIFIDGELLLLLPMSDTSCIYNSCKGRSIVIWISDVDATSLNQCIMQSSHGMQHCAQHAYSLFDISRGEVVYSHSLLFLFSRCQSMDCSFSSIEAIRGVQYYVSLTRIFLRAKTTMHLQSII
jgi:hypothetical protein